MEQLPDPDKIQWLTDDLKSKSANPSTETREKRKLSPENEKAAAEFSPLKSFARSAANAAMFGGGDRLASWLKGENVEDTREMSARAREQNPKSSIAGDVAGNVLGSIPLSGGLAAAAPLRLGANTVRSALMREGAAGAISSTAEEGIKAAEGRGEFSPGHVAASTIFGGLGGAAGVKLPELFGHARTIASKVRDRPLDAAERAAMDHAGNFGARHGFRGDAALDTAQRARFTENPDLADMAANIERLKTRGGPQVRAPQEDAFRAGGLDRFMDASVPNMSVRGRNRGQYQQYPPMSGQAVGQSRNAIPAETVLQPQGPIPQAAQDALDRAYRSRDQLWQTQSAHGTWSPTGPRPQPQPNEFKMWEDVLDPRINPMSREDLHATRRALGAGNPQLRTRMGLEQQADEVAQIRGAIRNAPETPTPDPFMLSAGFGLPRALNRIGSNAPFVGVSRPLQFTDRYARAANIAKDPSMADIIGRLTGAQAASGAGMRASLETLIQALSSVTDKTPKARKERD
jgi:hypothetical protein